MNEHKAKKGLAVNTLMLYILSFSNVAFSFMTVPYETRVLGPETYGILGFSLATITYFQLVLDFGFLISGTAEIAREKNDPAKVAKICESILLGKCILLVFCAAAMLVLCETVPAFAEAKDVLWVCLMYTFLNTLVPNFLYRGMEQMKPITYRVVLTKFIFTLGVFVFVKDQADYILVPWIHLVGSCVSVIFAYVDVFRRFKLKPVKITLGDVFGRLKSSFMFFVSRIASTVSTATNTLLIGMVFPGQAEVGYYTSADKFVTLARQAASPISDSLYPYMIANKDFKLVKKILLTFMPIIVLGSGVLFAFAPQICALVFGAEYAQTAIPLRCLIPVIIFVLPDYIFGFPMMTPLGVEKYANISVIVSACFQITALIVLYLTNTFSIVSLCLTTSITTFITMTFRIVVVLRAMKKLKQTAQ